MRLARTTDSAMAYVNRREARRANATTADKGTTFFQMLLMTAGLLLGTMLILHLRIL